MEGRTIWELQYLLQACWLGVRFGWIYDGMGLFRVAVPHKVWQEEVEDFIFWIICCFWVFFLMFEKDNGVVRGYILLAVLSCMGLWHYTLGRWLQRKLGKWIRKAKKYMKFLLTILKKKIRPFKMRKKQELGGKENGTDKEAKENQQHRQNNKGSQKKRADKNKGKQQTRGKTTKKGLK